MEILKALELHRTGRLAEAVQIYRQILQTDPDNADALHLLGNAACQLGDTDSSIAFISRAHILAPKNTAYLISLGMAYRANNLFEPALDCYAKVLEIDPHSASAYFATGNTLQNMGKPDEAARNFAQALELNPGFTEARYNLANIEKSFGKYSDAVIHYRVVVTDRPDFADAYHNMGSALYEMGKLDEALDSYEQALACCNLPDTQNNIGIIYLDQGKSVRALDHFKQAVALKPDYAEAYNNMGMALRKLGKIDDAAAAYSDALFHKPDFAQAHLNRGDLLMERNSVNDAAIHYEQAISFSPTLAQAHFNLGVARSRLNQLQSALTCFEQAVACNPHYQDALYNLGVVNGRLMRTHEAEKNYRQVLGLNPAHVNAHINLAAILTGAGSTSEAKTHLDLAYSQQNIFEKHSAHANKTLLILFDAGTGNLNLSHLINEDSNNIIDWMIEYASVDQFTQLPNYNLVFNAMGDPDTTGNVAGQLSSFLSSCTKPLLNHPDKVARTARNQLPSLLEGIEHLFIPSVWRFADSSDWDENLAHQLPLLIRPVHTQGGIGLIQANSADDLARIRSNPQGPVYVSRFVDFRSADSWYRKYRIIFIDRKPYPYHLAISPNWMVHYYTAGMDSHPWKLEEEKVFLQHPEMVLGASGMRAIEAIGKRLDLDYAGIDFSILPDGRILVFEANPTMLVHPENESGPLNHKNVYVRQILDAFENLLERKCGLAY